MAKAGDFVSRWNARAFPARRKIVDRGHCPAGRFVDPLALQKAGRGSLTGRRHAD